MTLITRRNMLSILGASALAPVLPALPVAAPVAAPLPAWIVGTPGEWDAMVIRRQKGAPMANRPWSDEEREAVLAAAKPHVLTPVALMMFTGLGPKEALSLTRESYRDGAISTSRAKTGEPVFWPVPIPLAMILAAAPQHDAPTLCANSDGKPWTLSGFRASWRPVRVKLEAEGKVQPGLTLYGLRHTVAVILREIGHDERSIADALGQKTIEMARHYARGADLAPKMRGIVASLDTEFAQRSVKPDGRKRLTEGGST